MSPTIRRALTGLMLCIALAGCSGNYKFDDGDYRPLGTPQILNRGN